MSTVPEYDGRRQRGSDKAMALDLYMETLPGCKDGLAHRFIYGQLVCNTCFKPIESALAERLAAAERVVFAVRRLNRVLPEGNQALTEDANFQVLRAVMDYEASRGGDQ